MPNRTPTLREELVFKPVAKASALVDGQILRVDIPRHQPALLARVDGVFHATSLHCTHLNALLHLGALTGHRLACPLHGGAFDVRDGTPLCAPTSRPLETYPVRVTGDDVEIALPEGEARGPSSGFEW